MKLTLLDIASKHFWTWVIILHKTDQSVSPSAKTQQCVYCIAPFGMLRHHARNVINEQTKRLHRKEDEYVSHLSASNDKSTA